MWRRSHTPKLSAVDHDAGYPGLLLIPKKPVYNGLDGLKNGILGTLIPRRVCSLDGVKVVLRLRSLGGVAMGH